MPTQPWNFTTLWKVCGVLAHKNGCIVVPESERPQAASDYILDDAIEYVVDVWPHLMEPDDGIENEEFRSTLADVWSVAWWLGYDGMSDEMAASWILQALDGAFVDKRDDVMQALRAGFWNGKNERNPD